MTEENDKDLEPLPKRGYGIDAYEPGEIAEQVLRIGVKKSRYPVYKTLTLGLMGGGFISLGALYELYILAHPLIEHSTAALIAPLFYAMGYIIAFIAGAEIFTTNNLSAMAWASGQISLWEITKNWTIVLIANLLGTMFIVALFFYSGLVFIYDLALVDAAKTISAAKLTFNPLQTTIIGIFGNLLICSGLWLAMAGRSLTDKFIALFLPVAAVPAMNFQHSTGNMFQFFLALVTETDSVDLELPSEITFWAVTGNLFFVSIGNIIGGGVLIALIYYFVFIRETRFDVNK
jgi:formate transporter